MENEETTMHHDDSEFVQFVNQVRMAERTQITLLIRELSRRSNSMWPEAIAAMIEALGEPKTTIEREV